ncbi:MAG: response regulator [Balneolales bacterium]
METVKNRILCIEDNADNQILLKFYLKKEPYNITFADDGPQAMEMIKNERFDLFLVDMNLPNGMSGYEVTKHIRQNDNHKDKPVLIITAFSRSELDEPDPSLRIDQFITKPIRKKEFIEIMNSFLKS